MCSVAVFAPSRPSSGCVCEPTIFHDTFQSNNSCCPQAFSILSVALCLLMLCTQSSSSFCHPCDNISSIVSSVSLLTQALDLLGEISWDV